MSRSYMKQIRPLVVCLLLTPALWATEGKDVAYPSGDETVHGLLFTPSGKGPFPALLAIHAVFGLDNWTKEQASKLADAGYLVLALDFYQGKVAKTLDEGAQISRAIPVARKQRDVLAAIHFLRSQSNVRKDRVGSIGWCMGGTWSFQLATLDPLLKVAVIRYGHVSDDASLLGKINARVLGIFGGKDTSIPVTEIRSFEQRMKDLGNPVEIVIYPEAGHAFETPESTHSFGSAYSGYRPADTADAWKRTLNFLDANLKSPDNSENDKQGMQTPAGIGKQAFKVVLLGTGGPAPRVERFGPSTLVEAGSRLFLFDCGRGAAQRLFQLGMLRDANAVFLTHLHSDHVVGIPDLWLTGWFEGRSTALQVWGPTGTRDMMSHLRHAYEFDIQVRSGAAEHLPPAEQQ